MLRQAYPKTVVVTRDGRAMQTVGFRATHEGFAEMAAHVAGGAEGSGHRATTGYFRTEPYHGYAGPPMALWWRALFAVARIAAVFVKSGALAVAAAAGVWARFMTQRA